MKTINFNNGDKMPMIGLGTWKSDPGVVKNAILAAIRAGYRHIDCAKIYNNEQEVGEAIRAAVSDGIVKREELWITSKLWNNAHKKEDVLPAIQNTLNDLQLDYLDLYLIHWPIAHQKDIISPRSEEDFMTAKEAPLVETWEAMLSLKENGLAKHVGVANFNITHLEQIISSSGIKPEMNQVELHPFLQQIDLIEYCKINKIPLTGYSPLGSGSSKKDRPILLKNEVLIEISKKHKCSAAQVSLAWALKRGTAVIPKSTHKERIEENFAAQSIVLDEEDLIKISGLDKNHRFIDGNFWTSEKSPYSPGYLWGDRGISI